MRTRRGAAWILAALVAALPPARADAPPTDAVIHDVLDLVQRTHVAPGRAQPQPMLRGALAAARRREPAVAWTEADEAWRVEVPGRDLAVRVAGDDATPLADALSPALESLLDALAREGDERDRASWRATLLDGALRALDRWSGASTGRRRADQQARREGRVVGVGVRIGRRDGVVRVLGVVPESGAEAAGLRSGDEIVSVDCRPVEGLTIADVLALLRGPSGTRAALGVPRLGPVAVEAERKEIPQPSVTRRLRPDGVGVLRIAHVSRATPREVARALAAWKGSRPRGLVLDLRGNTGGSMLGAAAVADLFVDAGVLTEALDDMDREVPGLRARVQATPGGDVTTPLVVLVDRKTASSAELLAAALAWNGRARLLGERTFGKVVVGKPHSFDACDLTVTITSAIMRAAGRRLPQEGLEPDVALDPAAPDAIDRAATLVLGDGGR